MPIERHHPSMLNRNASDAAINRKYVVSSLVKSPPVEESNDIRQSPQSRKAQHPERLYTKAKQRETSLPPLQSAIAVN